jgi:hypothetical protein
MKAMHDLPTIRRFQTILVFLVALAFFAGVAFASVLWVVLSS